MRLKIDGRSHMARGGLIQCLGLVTQSGSGRAGFGALLSSAGWRHGRDQTAVSQKIRSFYIPKHHQTRPGRLHAHMEGLEEDIKEVDSLLSVAVRPLVRGRLALLLSDLQQVKILLALALGYGSRVGGRTRFPIFGAFGSLH